eukprot:EC824801.1.p1 GENE.EC824801.1~~EC824801.1.p1  ORF type:complete len:227 (+),score=88.26 EC824801.1:23-682(+)
MCSKAACTIIPINKFPFKAIELPFPRKSLAPFISEETVNFHYDKHHQGYVTKLNALAETQKALKQKSIEQIFKTEKPGTTPFNLSAQILNHDFYWMCLKPAKGAVVSKPKENMEINKVIKKTFGTFDKFKEEFSAKAAGHFGSGWCWLVNDKNDEKVKIVDTHDAINPMIYKQQPLLVCDVWEHAYYIDTRADRAKYISNYFNLINWEFVEKSLKHYKC